MMRELTKTLALLVLVTAGCAQSDSPPTYMGNTNWLVSCGTDRDCSDGLSCECGVCTRTCSRNADCAELESSCDSDSQALVAACGDSSETSLCLPDCGNDDDCGDGLACVDARCLPIEISSGIDAPIGCGPNGAFTSAVLAPDQDCTTSPDNATIAIGRLDVSSGFRDTGETGCAFRDYVASFLVYSCLPGVDDTLQIHSAEITLRTEDNSIIEFDRADAPLANPFLVTSNATLFPMRGNAPRAGVATVEIVPGAYADQLDGLDGEKILADVQLFGATLGGTDVELRSFVFPIEICLGCFTICGGHLDPETSEDEIYGQGVCRDQAGADGRICIDVHCTESI